MFSLRNKGDTESVLVSHGFFCCLIVNIRCTCSVTLIAQNVSIAPHHNHNICIDLQRVTTVYTWYTSLKKESYMMKGKIGYNNDH